MKVEQLEKKNTFKLVPETEEDLWTLYKIIDPGDIVGGYSYWILKSKEDSKGKEKVKVWIKIKVIEVKFHEYSNMLRVRGEILKASKVVEGKFYTFNIEPGTEFVLEKKTLTKYHLKELENALKKRKKFLVCSLDDREYCIAVLQGNKVKVLEEGSFNISKQYENFDELYHQRLVELAKKIASHGSQYIVILSPLFWKDKLLEVLKEKFPEIKKVRLFSVSRGGIDGIYEFLRRKEYLNSLKELEIAEVNAKILEFLESMVRGLYVAGLESVMEAARSGAVEYIIISEIFFKKMKEEGKSELLINLFKTVEQKKGEIYFAKRENENFELIEKLGGIVGKLRYKLF